MLADNNSIYEYVDIFWLKFVANCPLSGVKVWQNHRK